MSVLGAAAAAGTAAAAGGISSGALAGIASGVGAIGSSAINAIMQSRTNAVNRAMAEQAYQRELEAIRRQNEYNSPAMQVARLRAAGLNPSLAYGADGQLTGMQSDVPHMSPIPAESPSVGNLSAGLTESIRAGLEVREQENRNALAMAEVAFRDAASFKAYVDSDMTDTQKRFLLETWDLQIENLRANNSKTWEEVAYLIQQRNESKSRVKLNDAQIKSLAAGTRLKDAQVREILELLPARVRNMDADTRLKYIQCEEGKAMIRQIAASITMMEAQTEQGWAHLVNEAKGLSNEKFGLDLQDYWNRRNLTQKYVEMGTDVVLDISKIIIGAGAISNMSKLPNPVKLWTPQSMTFGGQNYTFGPLK